MLTFRLVEFTRLPVTQCPKVFICFRTSLFAYSALMVSLQSCTQHSLLPCTGADQSQDTVGVGWGNEIILGGKD